MQSALKRREQQMGVVRVSMMKEKDEELALFLEMNKREKYRNDLFLNSSQEFDAPLGAKPGTSPIFKVPTSTPAPVRKIGVDDFLSSDNDKNDYDWLLTSPGTPLFPSLEMESQKTIMRQLGMPKAQPVALKSRLSNHQSEPTVKRNLSSRQPASSLGLNPSTDGTRRPSSYGGSVSRPAPPTGRPTLNTISKLKPSTPTSRLTLSSAKPSTGRTTATVSSIKPTVSLSRATTSKTVDAYRSSTPLSRITARSSKPTSRPTLPPSKSTSRACTPARQPSTTSSAFSPPALPIKSSYSIYKPTSKTSRNPVPSRGATPTVRSRLLKPSDMPDFSLDDPPNNLRTTLPERQQSVTRGRPGTPTARSSSVEPATGARPKQQSCSPSRGRASNGISRPSGSSLPAGCRGNSKVNDNASPVVIGTKMVERVINMRKLNPPKQDSKLSSHSNLSGKPSSPGSSHFGSTLSKRSLDMAIRHMDIRRTIPGNLRPLMTNIPASSMYNVQSGTQRSRTVGASESLATSTNASSEVSVHNDGLCIDNSEVEDETDSDRGYRSPASIRGR